jgi:hypothetical protein
MEGNLRSICAFALLAFPVLAVTTRPTTSGSPRDRVTWTGAAGATFAQHPLRFDNPTLGQEDIGASAYRDFPAGGVYTWYCNIHGVNGGSMKGRVAVTDNHLPVAWFTASATDVASGTEVTFDASGSSDADLAQSPSYSWDLDGNGADDAGQTSVSPSAMFTNTGATPRNVTVRLTATDTNSDAVGPESSTTTKVITIAPAPAPGPAPSTGPADDTTPPVVHLTLVKSLIVATKLRVTFTRLTLAVTDDAGNGTTLKRALKLKLNAR